MTPLAVLWAVLASPLAVDVAVVPHPLAQGNQVQAEEAVRTVLRAAGRNVLPGPDTVLGISQAREAGWSCDGAAECMVPLARALAVPTLVEVHLDSGLLRARRLESGAVTAEAFCTWPASAMARGRLGRALTGTRGGVEVAAPVATRIRLDGEDLWAPAPVTTVSGLPRGPHLLEVTTVDGTRHSATLQVEDAPVRVEMTPQGLRVAGGAVATTAQPAGGNGGGGGGKPIWLGAVGLGVGAGLLALGSVLSVGVGAALLAATGARAQSAPRDGAGRLAAQPGQPRAEVERLRQALLLGLGGGAALVMVGALLGALGLLSGGGAVVVLALWRSSE